MDVKILLAGRRLSVFFGKNFLQLMIESAPSLKYSLTHTLFWRNIILSLLCRSCYASATGMLFKATVLTFYFDIFFLQRAGCLRIKDL